MKQNSARSFLHDQANKRIGVFFQKYICCSCINYIASKLLRNKKKALNGTYRTKKRAMVIGCIPPAFLVKRGYRPNADAAGARTCPRLPHVQFWRTSKVPADLAEHAKPFCFPNTSLGLTGPRRTRGLTHPPFWPHVGGICPRKSTKFMYYPRVTVLSPHLTEIIPLHDHFYGSPKSRYKHMYTSPHTTARTAQGRNNRRTTGSCEYSRSISSGFIIHEEQNSIWNQIFDYGWLYLNIQFFAN